MTDPTMIVRMSQETKSRLNQLAEAYIAQENPTSAVQVILRIIGNYSAALQLRPF